MGMYYHRGETGKRRASVACSVDATISPGNRRTLFARISPWHFADPQLRTQIPSQFRIFPPHQPRSPKRRNAGVPVYLFGFVYWEKFGRPDIPEDIYVTPFPDGWQCAEEKAE